LNGDGFPYLFVVKGAGILNLSESRVTVGEAFFLPLVVFYD
jgi:hypothetical protein